MVFAGFSAWLVAAELEPVWSRCGPRYGSGVFWTMAGLYLGWVSVAVLLNLTTTLVAIGAPLDGPAGVGGQLAILVGVTATTLALVRWTRAQPAYVAAVVTRSPPATACTPRTWPRWSR